MPQTSPGAKLRAAIPWSLAVLLAGVALQIGLAGAGLLSDPGFLQPHRALGPWLSGLALAVVAVALVAKDWPVTLGAGLVLALLMLQGPLLRATGLVRSLHAASALLTFAICLLLLRERLPVRREP